MTKQEILNWFNGVCAGIRAEYENGATIRDYMFDKKDLSRMLDKYNNKCLCFDCVHTKFVQRRKK